MTTEDEEVTITAINGRTITFTPALVYPHKNQLAGSTRTDLYPVVMKRGGKNISIKSEVTDDIPRRGHTVCMHHDAVMDFWDAEFVGLGRTEKRIHGGIISDGSFKRASAAGDLVIEPLTNRSNLISRYPIHAHHCGFGHGHNTATVNNCYVEDAPGWAIVHHSCEANLDNNAMFRFAGAGMVSEQGNEIGSWVGNLAMQTTVKGIPHFVSPKLGVDPKYPGFRQGDKEGDNFWRGYGFGFRGRAMRTNRNVAVSCAWGHVYYHRTNTRPEKNLQQVLNPLREYLDLGTTGYKTAGDHISMTSVNVPIQHNADNVAIACCGGLFVTKDAPTQGHDGNIHFKDFLSWGYSSEGFAIEYIGSYLLENIDCVSGHLGGCFGISTGGNTFQLGLKNCRTEGNGRGIHIDGADTVAGRTDRMNNVEDPRWYIIGHESVNDSIPIFYTNTTGQVTNLNAADVTRFENDWQGTTFNRFADPDETLPLVLGDVAPGGSVINNLASNASGSKTDQLGSGVPFFEKSWDDKILPVNRSAIISLGREYGYFTNNGKNVVIFPTVVSDRVTARPHKKMHWFETTDIALMSNLGPVEYSATPVAVANARLMATVATNGSAIVDVIAGAIPSGGDGINYKINADDHTSPDHGVATYDESTGEVTYTPDAGYEGTDFLYIMIESASQFRTVRLDFLIGSIGSGITTPVVNTHFSAVGGAGYIDVTLSEPPDVDKRRIKRVEYSTDGGVTWRRLCQKWVKAKHRIRVNSDGMTITAGSYNLRTRYQTDYEWGYSSPSAAAVVTVN